jgi:peroxiredoxin Q/BCP
MREAVEEGLMPESSSNRAVRVASNLPRAGTAPRMSTPGAATDAQLLEVGDELPAFTLRDDRGELVDLRAVAQDSTVILFFYPRDNGLRCRTQACALRDSWPLLRSEGIEVFGVNHQGVESHAAFRDRYGLPFPLLCDEDLALAKAFGFVNWWAVPPISPIERSTVIIDPGGKVRVILRRVKPNAHFDILRADLGLKRREDAPAPAAAPELDVDMEVGTDEEPDAATSTDASAPAP